MCTGAFNLHQQQYWITTGAAAQAGIGSRYMQAFFM